MNLLPSLNAQPAQTALPAAARPGAPASLPRSGPGFAQALERAREGEPTPKDSAEAAGPDGTAPDAQAKDPTNDGAQANDARPADAKPSAAPAPALATASADDPARLRARPAAADAAIGRAAADGASRATPTPITPGRADADTRGTVLVGDEHRPGAAADPSSGTTPEAVDAAASRSGFAAALRALGGAGTGTGVDTPYNPAAGGTPAAGGLAAPGTPPPAPAAAPPAEASVAARPGSPAFAGELSARLVTFVREGVEHARLHLNPAEMGPVEVRIRIEGDAARVLLAAEQAPTRQWLEQALPSLAGGLREAGLTLAGGGVFERGHGGGGGGSDDGDGGDGRAPEGGRGAPRGDADQALGEAAAARALGLPRRRGVVDLVA
jgi:flagellar hook-length control protein FliK